jgi:hypothetical protein
MLFVLVTESVNQANVVPSNIAKQRNRANALEIRADFVLLVFVISMTSKKYMFADIWVKPFSDHIGRQIGSGYKLIRTLP